MTPQIRLARRMAVWQTIVERDLAPVWAGFIGDVALDLGEIHGSLDAVLADPRFADKCAQEGKGYPFFQGFTWDVKSILAGVHRGRGLSLYLLDKFMGMVSKRFGGKEISATDQEEYRGILLERIIAYVKEFKPGIQKGEDVDFYGLEAYLIRFAYERGFRSLSLLSKVDSMLSLDALLGNDFGKDLGERIEFIAPGQAVTPAVVPDSLDEETAMGACTSVFKGHTWGKQEKEVFFLTVAGFDTKEIARLLDVSGGYVRILRSFICSKLLGDMRRCVASLLGGTEEEMFNVIAQHLYGKSRSLCFGSRRNKVDEGGLDLEVLRQGLSPQ